jgi:hypothetical protein
MSGSENRPGHDNRPEDDDDDWAVGDVIRRAVNAGRRTVKTGQERLEHIASDILNNDKVEAVGSAFHGFREEVVRVFGKELAKYLERLDLTDALVRVLTSISLELKTEIRFIPNDKKLVKPEIKNSVTVKQPPETP